MVTLMYGTAQLLLYSSSGNSSSSGGGVSCSSIAVRMSSANRYGVTPSSSCDGSSRSSVSSSADFVSSAKS